MVCAVLRIQGTQGLSRRHSKETVIVPLPASDDKVDKTSIKPEKNQSLPSLWLQ